MKYPIHYDESFKDNLREHVSAEIIDAESQSTKGLFVILYYLLDRTVDGVI